MQETFSRIYEQKTWCCTVAEDGKLVGQTESKSGGGSTLKQTAIIRQELPSILEKFNIRSMLDAPCGDLNWMKEIDLKDCDYIGADIVPDLITQNITLYSRSKKTFLVKDIVSDDLPKVDLIFCRDCLVHLSVSDVLKTLSNFKKSGSTYLLTTTFLGNRKNKINMITGDWHPINLFQTPYNFPEPLLLLNEGCTEGGNQYSDKSLGLWQLDSLAITP